jgi:hypothetical protein
VPNLSFVPTRIVTFFFCSTGKFSILLLLLVRQQRHAVFLFIPHNVYDR